MATLIFGAFGLTAAVVILHSNGSISTAIHQNRVIQKSFRLAHDFIRTRQTEQNRLPSESEFVAWTMRLPHQAFSPRHVMFMPLEVDEAPPAVLVRFGPPSPGQAYLLSFWHADVMDYSPSWTEETSLVVDKADFYFFGTHTRDSLFWGLLSVAMVISSRFMAPSRGSSRRSD